MAQEQDQGADTRRLLLAFGVGAAVGAAVALLFAPAAGEDTRRAMNQRTRESRDRVMEALRQGRGLLNQRRQTIVNAFERARRDAEGSTLEGEPGA